MFLSNKVNIVYSNAIYILCIIIYYILLHIRDYNVRIIVTISWNELQSANRVFCWQVITFINRNYKTSKYLIFYRKHKFYIIWQRSIAPGSVGCGNIGIYSFIINFLYKSKINQYAINLDDPTLQYRGAGEEDTGMIRQDSQSLIQVGQVFFLQYCSYCLFCL